VKTGRLHGSKNLVGRREKFIFSMFSYLKPVETLHESDVSGPGALTTAAAKEF